MPVKKLPHELVLVAGVVESSGLFSLLDDDDDDDDVCCCCSDTTGTALLVVFVAETTTGAPLAPPVTLSLVELIIGGLELSAVVVVAVVDGLLVLLVDD